MHLWGSAGRLLSLSPDLQGPVGSQTPICVFGRRLLARMGTRRGRATPPIACDQGGCIWRTWAVGSQDPMMVVPMDGMMGTSLHVVSGVPWLWILLLGRISLCLAILPPSFPRILRVSTVHLGSRYPYTSLLPLILQYFLLFNLNPNPLLPFPPVPSLNCPTCLPRPVFAGTRHYTYAKVVISPCQ